MISRSSQTSKGKLQEKNKTSSWTPPIVGKEEYDTAKAYLQSHIGLNVDRLLEGVNVSTLFSMPLGPNAECLNVDQLEEYVGLNRGNQKAHISQCEECRKNVELYKELEAEGQAIGRRVQVGLRKREPLILQIGAWAPILSIIAIGLFLVLGSKRNVDVRKRDTSDEAYERDRKVWDTAVERGKEYLESGKETMRETGKTAHEYMQSGKETAREVRREIGK